MAQAVRVVVELAVVQLQRLGVHEVVRVGGGHPDTTSTSSAKANWSARSPSPRTRTSPWAPGPGPLALLLRGLGYQSVAQRDSSPSN